MLHVQTKEPDSIRLDMAMMDVLQAIHYVLLYHLSTELVERRLLNDVDPQGLAPREC